MTHDLVVRLKAFPQYQRHRALSMPLRLYNASSRGALIEMLSSSVDHMHITLTKVSDDAEVIGHAASVSYVHQGKRWTHTDNCLGVALAKACINVWGEP